MDYEKHLKEALSDVNTPYIITAWIEEKFPELVESEDEKIRKELIEHCKNQAKPYIDTGNECPQIQSWIAWLEKQNEPFDDNIITRDDEILQAISVGLTDMKENFGWSDFGGLPIEEIQDWLEKQSKENMIEALRLEYEKGKADTLQEQRKEWSEEDEYTLYETIQHLEELIRIDKAKHLGCDVQYYQRDIDWLKSIKDRVQPKQDWSEEDERIRKWIISDLKETLSGEDLEINMPEYAVKLREAIAWLEKQCCGKIVDKSKTEKQKVLLTETDGNANIVWDTRSLDDVETLLKCGLEYVKKLKATTPYKDANKEYWRGYREGKQEVLDKYAELEKQGEQKPINDTDEDIVEAVKDTSILDMVESKFHEGDWVAYNSQNAVSPICQITKVDGDIIDLKGLQGERFQTEYWDLNENYHLWTIQDAKDGDVLVDVYGNIGIFQKNDDFDWTSYCSLGVNGGFQCFKVEHENDKTHPATKEQRDLLFQKMKDAGYEWDAEKKELKKCVIDEGKDEMDYCFTKMMNGEKVSPAWSEEDEEMFNFILKELDLYCDSNKIRKIIDWLESIKERIK